jgi:hypothetical protein
MDIQVPLRALTNQELKTENEKIITYTRNRVSSYDGSHE